MKNFCFLYNPSANRNRSRSKFEKLKKYTNGWSDVEYNTAKNSKDLKERAREAAKYFEIVVACGGDGTVRDVAVSIMNTQAKLGVVPLGSGNDFSKSLGLPSDLVKTLDVLKKRESKAVDLGKCNDFYFINTLGFGFDGETNFYAGESKIANGALRYGLAALKTNIRMVPFDCEVSVDGNRIEGSRWIMLTVANGRVEGGNFMVSPDASPFDGILNLVTIDPVSKWILPFLLPLLIVGKQSRLSYVTYHNAQEIGLSFKKSVFIHSDGEQISTLKTEFNIKILPAAIRVIC